MPTEQQFESRSSPLGPWDSSDPQWRGSQWTDYVIRGNNREGFGDLGDPTSWRTLGKMLLEITNDEEQWLGTSDLSSGYLYAFPPGDRTNPLNGPFPAGEWKDGSLVRVIWDNYGVRYWQDYTLVQADPTDPEQVIEQPPWIIEWMYNNNIAGTEDFLQRVGFWVESGPLRNSEQSFNFVPGGMSRGTRQGRGNGRSGNGKSQIPWILAAAFVAKMLL